MEEGDNEGWDKGDHKCFFKEPFTFLDWCVTKEHAQSISGWAKPLECDVFERAQGAHTAAEMGSAVKGNRACVNKTRGCFPPVAHKETAGYVGGKFSEGH